MGEEYSEKGQHRWRPKGSGVCDVLEDREGGWWPGRGKDSESRSDRRSERGGVGGFV